MTKDCHNLGKFELTGIPPAPRGVPQIEVTFEVDANGILQVSAEDKGTGKAEKITITAEKGRLSDEEIERMVKEAEDYAEEDKKIKERIDARNGLESYLYNLKNTLEDDEKGVADNISAEDKKELQGFLPEASEQGRLNSFSKHKWHIIPSSLTFLILFPALVTFNFHFSPRVVSITVAFWVTALLQVGGPNSCKIQLTCLKR